MKKSSIIVLAVLSGFSLTALNYINHNDSHSTPEKKGQCNPVESDSASAENRNTGKFDIFYNVDSRFNTIISKKELLASQSIVDIVPKSATDGIEYYKDNKVTIFVGEDEFSEIGHGANLNEAQLQLLRLTEYSTNIRITSNFKTKNVYTGFLEDDYLTYYMTIVPETEANYKDGLDALFVYLRESSKEAAALVNPSHLRAGQISFIINNEGKVIDVDLTSTSGYASFDDAMMEIISAIPGDWHPATNESGENVEQEFIFFYGTQGC